MKLLTSSYYEVIGSISEDVFQKGFFCSWNVFPGNVSWVYEEAQLACYRWPCPFLENQSEADTQF